jgi:hypothetical protein
MGAERKSQYIDDKAKLVTAYHEVRYHWLFLANHSSRLLRADMLLSPYIRKGQCLYIRLPVYLAVMHWV